MDMMLFLRKYGFLFIPPVYWLIYLGARLTYNGLAGEFSPDFFQGIRHEGVYIICSLCVFYFFCLEVEVGDGEFSANILFLIVFFHVVLLFITLLICLWQGRCCWIRSLWVRLLLPCVYCFYSSAFHYKKEFLVRI